jgi:hypothetical protein
MEKDYDQPSQVVPFIIRALKDLNKAHIRYTGAMDVLASLLEHFAHSQPDRQQAIDYLKSQPFEHLGLFIPPHLLDDVEDEEY